MRKQFIATTILLSTILNFGTAAAEQPAAQEYREIFRGGNFYLEFKDKWGTRIIASENGMRMERMNYTFEHGAMTWLNPLGALFGGTGDKNPEVMYRDGMFYHFVAKRKANVCAEKNLRDENLNPKEGWNKIHLKLAVPDELAVFCWNDPYRTKSPAVTEPKFSESLKKFFDGKEYDCDRYVGAVRTIDGNESARLIYDMFYKNGQLFRAELYLKRNDTDYPVGELEIVKILRDIPPDTFQIYKGTKLYAAGTGDIDDLLENPKEIGTMGDS